MRPKEVVKEFGRDYPKIWQLVKKARGQRGKEYPSWADWCYVPISALIHELMKEDVAKALALNPGVIAAAATWRITQGVYRFDVDLYNALINQSLSGNIPCDVLKRLPEWCVYVETINATYLGNSIYGFWVHLETDLKSGREELRFVFLQKDGENIPFIIHIGDWTIEEGISRMQDEADKQAGVELPRYDYTDDITPFVQLVLYLCAENIDMPRMSKHPNTRVRLSGQVDVAREPRTWDVGIRVGAGIRKYRNDEAQQGQKDVARSTQGEGIRPHIRRAHWHHFWTGSRDKGNRKLVLRWLPPIPINIDEDEDNPVVIHEVKEGKNK